MDEVSQYFEQVNFQKVRTSHPPELIFLCGGKKNDSEKKFFRPLVEAELKKRGHNVVLAEDAMDWQGGQSFTKDLLELEKYYAALVSLIPLACESFGAVAELGAFVSDEAISNKLFIIIKEKYYSGEESNSFIRHGPIKNFEDHTKRKCFSISNENSENDLYEVCDEIAQCEPSTSNCDFSKGYFQILLLIDIINLMVVGEFKEIKKEFEGAIRLAGKEPPKDNKQLEEMLFVLESLDLVVKRSKGTKTYYLVKKQAFYLAYRAKSSANFVKNTTIRRRVLNNIYADKTDGNKAKISILKEEEKKLEWLNKEVLLDDIDVDKLLLTAPLQYKVYEIPKRTGGTRTIAQPTPKLKELQRAKVLELEDKLPTHSAAKAYIKGKNGILENAVSHKHSQFFYKFDFKDFFPSIKAKDFNLLLESHGFDLEDRISFIKTFFRFNKSAGKQKTRAVYSKLKNKEFNQSNNSGLLDFLTCNYEEEFQLSIGAPSSPFVSNVIMFEFDKAAHEWADKNNLIYSRYADDITFSSRKKIDIKIIQDSLNKILSDINYPNLELNLKKERFCSFKGQVNVTGLNITPDHQISIGRKKKKLISAMIHHYKNKKISKKRLDQLRGWLSYCKAVEPSFVKSMEKKYSIETIAEIMKTAA